MVFGERFFQRVLHGKSVESFGDPDILHSYSYTPDVAAGLVVLGTASGGEGARGVWMLPVNRAESTTAVVHRFSRAMDHEIPISRIPTWALRAMGVFSPIMREVAEMTYQWQQPYVLDDATFRAAFGFDPTPWDEAVAATVAWGCDTYGTRSAA